MTVHGRDVYTRPSETIRARYMLHKLNGSSPVNSGISRSMSPNSAKKILKKSSRISSRSNQESERQEKKQEDGNFDLSICGSSAPLSIQQQKCLKENYKYPRTNKKQIRKFETPLPVDKIIFLAERLEINDKSENNTEGSSEKKEGYLEGLERPSEEFIMPPDLNFYIDLSSLSNTNDESDGSCNEFEKSVQRKPQKEIESFCQQDDRPLSEAQSEEITTVKPLSIYSCKTPYPTFRENENDSEKAETRSNTRRTCRSDLICFYVNAVNSQSDLTRYIRPCHSCQETCCVCDSLVTSHRSIFKQRVEKELTETSRSQDGEKENKCVSTDDYITGFGSSSCECVRYTPVCSFRKRRNFENCFSSCRSCPDVPYTYKPISLALDEEDENFCQNECFCRCSAPPEVDWLQSVGENTVLAYTSSLASAAKSARSLAKDLESILNTLKNGNN